MSQRIILDTDLGTDVDDAMALAVLLGHPDVDLVAVTTVYGDTGLRARLAQRYAGLAGRRVAAYAGRSATRSGRAVWWAGHEGSLHEGLDDEVVETDDAVEVLVRTAARSPGELVVIAIGPLTNVAAALDADAAFATNVRRVVIMGGSFAPPAAEHNVRSDDLAAQRVFASSLTTVVTGLEITQQLRVGPDEVARMTAAGPLGAAVGRDIDQWWAHGGTAWNVPHDPVAVQTLLRPDLFTLSAPGRIMITTEADGPDDHAGVSTHVPDRDGTHRVVTGLDANAVATAIIDDIIRADRAGS